MSDDGKDFLGRREFNGNNENNVIHGSKDKDAVYAEGGHDTIKGSEGNDWNWGGSGVDTKDFSNMSSDMKLVINMKKGRFTVVEKDYNPERAIDYTGPNKEHDKLINIESIKGNDGDSETNVFEISGERYIDGAGGFDTIDLQYPPGLVGPKAEDFK